jgi:hypothetical protein
MPALSIITDANGFYFTLGGRFIIIREIFKR